MSAFGNQPTQLYKKFPCLHTGHHKNAALRDGSFDENDAI